MLGNIYTNNLRIAVFDIESMGLDPTRGPVITASFCDEDGGGLRQYYAESPECEAFLLNRIIEEFNDLDAIITYNGVRFDIPYIQTRAALYGLKIPAVWNIDVYKMLRKYWPVARKLPSLNQMSVETALGIRDLRTDEIAGEECIRLYNQYLLDGDLSNVELILLHNADDVRQLSRISNRIASLPFHRIVFDMGRRMVFRPDYPGSEDTICEFDPICFDGDKKLRLTGHCSEAMRGCSSVDILCDYDSFSGAFIIDITLREAENYKYIDLIENHLESNVFDGSDAFENGYLILMEGKEYNYKEINTLFEMLVRGNF